MKTPATETPVAQIPAQGGSVQGPEAVLSESQVPAGLPQTGLGSADSDNASTWVFMVIGLLIVASSATFGTVLLRRKVRK